MTAAQFLKVLEPFLDREALWTRETEFRTTASIFAPLSDALDRCGLAPTDIDFCLLVGGSSLIPYVQDAIRDYLTAARLLTFPDAETVQTAVARGAAYHALSLAVTGRGLVRPVTGNALQIQTQDGPVELIPTGSSLPYPSTPGAWAECRSLAIPQTGRGEPVELRVELLDGDGARTAHHLWSVAAPVRKGDPLLLKYRMDENQTLEVVMHLDGRPGEAEFQCKFENPLTTVVNPAVEREKIFALEELLATKQAPRAMWTHLMRRLAKLYESLGQCERALQWMKKAAKCSDRPDAGLLNRMGILCDRLRDYERSERYYREGADLDDDDGACLFNLSLSQQRRGLLREATSSIDEAILRDRKPAYLVLKAELCGATQRPADKASFLAEALESFAAPVSLDDWGLTWFRQAARLAGDTGLVADADREQDRRSDGEDTEQLTGHAPLLQHAGRE